MLGMKSEVSGKKYRPSRSDSKRLKNFLTIVVYLHNKSFVSIAHIHLKYKKFILLCKSSVPYRMPVSLTIFLRRCELIYVMSKIILNYLIDTPLLITLKWKSIHLFIYPETKSTIDTISGESAAIRFGCCLSDTCSTFVMPYSIDFKLRE